MHIDARRLEALLEGRRFRGRMRHGLRLMAEGRSAREAAALAGLRSHQDLAKLARELGIGRRRAPAPASAA